MSPDVISVDTGALRAASVALAGVAQQLGHGVDGSPGLIVPAPGAAGPALSALAVAVHEWLAGLGGRTAAMSDSVRLAVDDYDAADNRAVRRLVGPR